MSSEVGVTGEEAREELEAGDGVEQQRGRKRKREPDSWQRNQRKHLRNAGLSYIDRNNNTLIYSLTVSDAKVRVCKDFFLKTLDISEKIARSSLPNTTGDGMYESPKGKKNTQNQDFRR